MEKGKILYSLLPIFIAPKSDPATSVGLGYTKVLKIEGEQPTSEFKGIESLDSTITFERKAPRLPRKVKKAFKKQWEYAKNHKRCPRALLWMSYTFRQESYTLRTLWKNNLI